MTYDMVLSPRVDYRNPEFRISEEMWKKLLRRIEKRGGGVNPMGVMIKSEVRDFARSLRDLVREGGLTDEEVGVYEGLLAYLTGPGVGGSWLNLRVPKAEIPVAHGRRERASELV